MKVTPAFLDTETLDYRKNLLPVELNWLVYLPSEIAKIELVSPYIRFNLDCDKKWHLLTIPGVFISEKTQCMGLIEIKTEDE